MVDGSPLGPQLHWDVVRHPGEWRYARWCFGPVCGGRDGGAEIHGRLTPSDTAALDALVARVPPPAIAEGIPPQTDCGTVRLDIDRQGAQFTRIISGCRADGYVSAIEAILKSQP